MRQEVAHITLLVSLLEISLLSTTSVINPKITMVKVRTLFCQTQHLQAKLHWKIFPVLLAFISVNGQVKWDADCAWTCGSICYWSADVEAARAKGYSLFQNTSTIGIFAPVAHSPFFTRGILTSISHTDNYPHEYDNNEKFNFPTNGPWEEFPILSTFNVFAGGAPGPDRVIFDLGGTLDMLITHTGANGDSFVACTKS